MPSQHRRQRLSPPLALLAAAAVALPVAADVSWVEWLRFGVSRVVESSGELAAVPSTPAAPEAVADQATKADKWKPLRELLQGWEFTTNYAISVGNAKSGRLFVYEGGSFKMNTQIPTGSTSKWPSAMLFAGLVNDGKISSLDDKVSKYLSWWTTDPKDLRSAVTFRMLLSFTSGFGDGHPGEEANTRAAREWRKVHNSTRAPSTLEARLAAKIGQEGGALNCNTQTGDITACAKSIYANVSLIGTPGKVYSYNSNHLQIAAAVSVAVTGLDIHQVVKKYLLDAYGMTNSYYAGKCPDFGGSLITTGDDYEQFLEGVLSYKPLSKDIVDASEEDSTPFMSDMYTLYGNYGFGHFLWCFDSVDGMTDRCRQDRVHTDPGAFGFIPMIDRKHEYYVQVVSAEIPPTGSYPLSGIPEYLAVAIKPHVDAIMSATPPDPTEHLTHSTQFLSLGVADVNYCLNCVLHPKSCS